MITASLVKELREKTGAGMMDCKKALEKANGDINAATDWLREQGISKAAKKAERIAAEGLATIKIEGNLAAVVEVNSETDFVAKNPEFAEMVEEIAAAVLNSDAKDNEGLLEVNTKNGTVNELIVNKTAKIGEKLDLRRFIKVEKTDNQVFGSYIHMGGKIAVLVVTEGGTPEVAREVAMHAAAMRPLYVKEADVPTDVLEHEKEMIKTELLNEGKPEAQIEKIMIGKVKKYYEDICLENQIFVKATNKETIGEYLKQNNAKLVNMIRFEVGEGMEKRNEDFACEVAKQMAQK
jgi:elongation factor Ts